MARGIIADFDWPLQKPVRIKKGLTAEGAARHELIEWEIAEERGDDPKRENNQMNAIWSRTVFISYGTACHEPVEWSHGGGEIHTPVQQRVFTLFEQALTSPHISHTLKRNC